MALATTTISTSPSGQVTLHPPGHVQPIVFGQQPPPPKPHKNVPWGTLGVLGAILVVTAGVIWYQADD